MSEQELDLLKLPAGFKTQAGTGAAQMGRSNTIQIAFRGPSLHDAPDNFWTETARRYPLGFVDRAKDRTGRDSGSGQPDVDCKLDPGRDGHGSNVTTIAAEAGDYPMLFPPLDVLDSEPRYLRPSEAAAEETGIIA